MNGQSNQGGVKRATCMYLLSAIVVLSSGISAFGFTTQSQLSYGGFTTPNVIYTDLVETSTTDSFFRDDGNGGVVQLGNYGEPILTGDLLNFNAPHFSAQVFPGPDLDLTDGFLSFRLFSQPGKFVEAMRLEEFGSVSLTSPRGPNPLTLANVEAPLFLTIYEVLLDDGTPDGLVYELPSTITISGTMSVAPDRGPDGWNAQDHPDVSTWQGALLLNIPDALAAVDPTLGGGLPILGATQLDYRQNNLMTALAVDNVSASFIDKKGIIIEPIVTNVVPEPTGTTLVLLLVSMLGFRMGSRRRRQ
ncbi:MAG: hypothetical protein AAF497_07995 [Planctomycetota bacterium]